MKELIELGDKVKDKLTGFIGIATARVKYLNGCVQFCVDPGIDKKGKMQESHYIDEDQLAVVKKAECMIPQKVTKKDPGGPMRNEPPK